MNIDDLKETVELISRGVTKIRETGITDDALIVLIQQASPSVRDARRNHVKPTKKMIRAVIEGMENLEEYVFGEEEEDDDA